MNPKSSDDQQLQFWCSQLKISPQEFLELPYAQLEDKFRKWKSMQSAIQRVKNKKLQFIRNYAIKNLRSRGGVDPGPEELPGVIQAKVSLKDTRKNQKHDLDVEANTRLQGVSECQLKEILRAPGTPDISINSVQMEVAEVGRNDKKEFNIYRNEHGVLQVDCPNEWEDFVANL